jgi:hypothetical protein
MVWTSRFRRRPADADKCRSIDSCSADAFLAGMDSPLRGGLVDVERKAMCTTLTPKVNPNRQISLDAA